MSIFIILLDLSKIKDFFFPEKSVFMVLHYNQLKFIENLNYDW